MLTLRSSTDADIPAITAIYTHHVTHGTGTFETTPPTEADMAQRRIDVLEKGLPYLVAENGGRVLGFAYCQWFKPRPAYRFSAEDSIYLHPDAAGKGLGKQLLTALVREAEALDERTVAARALVGDDDVEERTGLGAAAGESDHDHDLSFGWWLAPTRGLPRFFRR